MTLIKTSLLNAMAVAIKMLTLLGINKVLAIYVGPAGYAALGQFQNAVQMITTFASGAINSGITKYTAEYEGDEKKQHVLWKTAGTVIAVGTLVAAVLVFVFHKDLALVFLKDYDLASVFIWLSVSLIFFTANTFFLAVLNGKKEITRYIVANIVGSLGALILTGWLSIEYGLYGALISLSLYQSVTCLATIFICSRTSWFKWSLFFGEFDAEVFKNLLKFAAMAICSAICVPISHILIRDKLGANFGWDAAGYWEAMWRLSSAYLLFISTTLSLYLLPKIASLAKLEDIKIEVVSGFKVVLPFVAVSGVCVYFFRDVIIHILFTKEFIPMRELFAWQLLGDFFRTIAWVLGYIMIAKAWWKTYIFFEILGTSSFYAYTVMFTAYGVESASIAHALNYIMYDLFVLCFLYFYAGKLSQMRQGDLKVR